MIKAGKLRFSGADNAVARLHIDEASDEIRAGELLLEVLPALAFKHAHEAARLSCAAFLSAQGLRPGSEGGHAAVINAVEAQIGHILGALIQKANEMRTLRNAIAYDGGRASVTVDMARDALATATDMQRGFLALVTSGTIPAWQQ